MKAAFVLYDYFPYGGLQRDCIRIAQACQARGVQVIIFCSTWQGEKVPGLKVVTPVKKGLSRTTKNKHFVDFYLNAVRDNFDVVLGFNRLPGLDYYYAADSCFAEKAYKERSWLYRLTPRCKQFLAHERAIFGPQSKTVSMLISPMQKIQFANHYATNAERIIELPPGIEKDRMAGSDAEQLRKEFRQEFDVNENDYLVLQLGSGFAVKGVDRSLRALASLPEDLKARIRFFLVGQDKPQAYLKLAKKLGLEENVTVFSGRDDVPRFLQGADLLLHPAYRESAGLVLVEAIVAGLPVLTTDTCGYAYHVEKAGAGQICASPFQQAELNKSLLQMLTAPDKKAMA
ncbi:glycosyltransferase family 4 protein [Gammaproteobacteria bacterium]|nr:glycosyltransferase family 4 protein [Gammaproteobacteria bacterium]